MTKPDQTLFDASEDTLDSIFEATQREEEEIELEEELRIVTAEASDDSADEPDEGDDHVPTLEDLLGDAMKAKAVAQRIKEARAKARRGFDISDDDKARIRKWDQDNMWTSVANVALFMRYECQCGNHYTIFSGKMLEQVGKYNATNWQCVAVKEWRGDLLGKTATAKRKVVMCQRCCAGKGFSLNSDIEWNV